MVDLEPIIDLCGGLDGYPDLGEGKRGGVVAERCSQALRGCTGLVSPAPTQAARGRRTLVVPGVPLTRPAGSVTHAAVRSGSGKSTDKVNFTARESPNPTLRVRP